MKYEEGYVIFERLVVPEPDVLGETKPVRAVNPFGADNAPGDLPKLALDECESSGRAAGARLQQMFAAKDIRG